MSCQDGINESNLINGCYSHFKITSYVIQEFLGKDPLFGFRFPRHSLSLSWCVSTWPVIIWNLPGCLVHVQVLISRFTWFFRKNVSSLSLFCYLAVIQIECPPSWHHLLFFLDVDQNEQTRKITYDSTSSFVYCFSMNFWEGAVGKIYLISFSCYT